MNRLELTETELEWLARIADAPPENAPTPPGMILLKLVRLGLVDDDGSMTPIGDSYLAYARSQR